MGVKSHRSRPCPPPSIALGTTRVASRGAPAARIRGRTSPAALDVDAYSAAVHPNALMRFGSAPKSSRSTWTTSSWPNCDAHIRGVDPFTSRSSTSGRLLGDDSSSSRRRSWRTRATSPQRAARCRGGEPRMSVVSRSDVNISGRLMTPATSSDDAGASASASSVRTARDATARGDGRRALARTGANRSPASPGPAQTRMDRWCRRETIIRFSSSVLLTSCSARCRCSRSAARGATAPRRPTMRRRGRGRRGPRADRAPRDPRRSSSCPRRPTPTNPSGPSPSEGRCWWARARLGARGSDRTTGGGA